MSKAIIIILFLFVPFFMSAQVKVSGFIRDARTGEMLVGASVSEKVTLNGTSSNNNGFFSLTTSGHPIQFSFVGYEKYIFKPEKDTLVIIQLFAGKELAEIEVSGIKTDRFNTFSLDSKQLQEFPSIGAKPDVVKTLQLIPGIQAQAEGLGFLNVRGGNPGENLYLIDGVPLFYVNHLGGFLSVFNPDMINKLDVYKSGFPAKYGGKLSSIIDITQREGNKKEWKANLGIGITDLSVSIEGPIIRDKASILFTGRKTLIEPLMILIADIADGNSFYAYYGFHDLNGKLSYRVNAKNSFHLNFYQGDDYFKYWTKKKEYKVEDGMHSNIWGNWLISAKWNKVVSSRFFVSNTMSMTKYRLNIHQKYIADGTLSTKDFEKVYRSDVRDISLRSDWQYQAKNNSTFNFGAKLTKLFHTPTAMFFTNNSNQNSSETIGSFNTTVYAGSQFEIAKSFDANLSIRLIDYVSGGYNQFAWEPRIKLDKRISLQHSLNVTFQKVHQFTHLLFTYGTIMNNEVWIPSNEDILPSESNQFSLGWKSEYRGGMFQSEVNVYYKSSSNLATYKEGYYNLLGDGAWRSKIVTDGSGISKGMEFLVRKTTGDWSGFAGLTLSKTTRHFAGINRGEEYLFEYNRPHSFALNINRKINDKLKINVVWVNQSGLPYTPVIGRHLKIDDSNNFEEVLIYGERNSKRMKLYHRLDLGLSYEKMNKKYRKVIWTFSIYNAYNQLNPNIYYYSNAETGNMTNSKGANDQQIKLYKRSFFPIIPTFSYKIFFD